MAKGKSLLSQTSSKSKKQDKYKETSEQSKFKYSFEIGENIIYKGIIDEYRNTIAIITKRSHKNQNEYYGIKFSLDDSELKDINGNILKNLEEHEAELANEEEYRGNKDQEYNQEEISEIEMEVLKNGFKSIDNKTTCMNPLLFYERRCEQCNSFKNVCVYRNKGKYEKIKF